MLVIDFVHTSGIPHTSSLSLQSSAPTNLFRFKPICKSSSTSIHYSRRPFHFPSRLTPRDTSLHPIKISAMAGVPSASMKLLFVEMGVGYDQHGQDINSAAMRACRDAISSNSIPAFRKGAIPGVSFEQMKLQIKLGVPRSLQEFLDIDKVKSVFPYGKIENIEVVDGGLICSSGVQVEEMGDKNEDCYIVNASVYVGY
ncbi:uncharacterized protein LOC124933642 [Impatiens glandulifera]|uniref:uncharacterized protein LOC124933642 n=1 Tax=Impatiens glandulifera TaxID=253017 RepID=UPI001FB1433C|nr:uncharacterized protein LOC124933642 [Impatiens glandulifera]